MATEATPLNTTAPADKVVAPETTVPTIVEPAAAEPIMPAVETKAAEPAKTEDITAVPEVPAATTTPHIEKAADQPTEPITEGTLGYKPSAKFPMSLIPGREHKYFFWLGDAAISHEKLADFTTSSKADFAQEAASWSNHTGKGLLYYAKDENKDSPAGVFPLYEATDVKENGVDFSFKIHGHKHIFTTDNATHTAGWVKAIKAEIEPAIARKEEVHNSEGFKTAQTSFHPTVASLSVPGKKSTDIERTTREENTSTTKSKSRSVSRGKGIFDRFGKKDAAATDAAVASEADASHPVADIPVAVPAVAAPAEASTIEPAAVSTSTEAAPVVDAATTTGVTGQTEKPTIAARRSSRIGEFFKKVTSPTTEKKETDVIPATTATEGETSTHAQDVAARVFAAPLVGAETTETAAAAPAIDTAETTAAPAQTEVITPGREKKKFSLPNLFEKKAKSPTTEAAPLAESTEAPIAAEPVVPVEAETAKPIDTTPVAAGAETKEATPVSPVDKNEKRRSSFFSGDIAGSIKKLTGQKKAADAEAVKESEEITAHPPAHVSNEYTAAATPRTDLALNMAKDQADKAHEKEALKEEKKEQKKGNSIMRRISTAIRSSSKDRKVSPTHATKEESAIAEEAPKIEEPAALTKPAEPVVPETTTPATLGSVTPATTESTPLATSHVVSTTA